VSRIYWTILGRILFSGAEAILLSRVCVHVREAIVVRTRPEVVRNGRVECLNKLVLLG